MPYGTNKWKPTLWGKAKAAFNLSQQPKEKPPMKSPPAPGRASEMVKRSKLAADGPKPSGMIRHITTQVSFNRDWAKEAQAAKSLAPQKEVNKGDQEKIASLNEKFRRSARAEREHDRGR